MADPLPGSDALLTELRDLIAAVSTSLIIAIDGRAGAGKSSLAAWLGEQLNLPVIGSDSHIIAGREPIEWRQPSLRWILHRRRRLRQPVIVEGTCLCRVLRSIDADPDFLIWVTNEGGPQHGPEEPTNDYIRDFKPLENADFVLTWRQAEAPA